MRRQPYHLRKLINKELKRLLENDIIKYAQRPQEWASNLVATPKSNGRIYARKVNSCIQRETYPIPTLASVIDNMTGATFFSKTDMKEAYQQLELSQNSRYLTNFHTKKRIMSFKRLCCVFSHFSVVPPKGFMKAFKAFKKLFETPQRRVKIGTNIHSKFSRKQYINL